MGRKIRTVREALDTKIDYARVIEALRLELEKRHILKSEVAAHFGWHPSTVSQKLRNTRPMLLKEFIEICEFAGIYPMDLAPEAAMAYSLKHFSLFTYLQGLVEAEIKKTVTGEAGRLANYDVVLVPKPIGPAPPAPPATEIVPDRRGRPKRAKPGTDGDDAPAT